MIDQQKREMVGALLQLRELFNEVKNVNGQFDVVLDLVNSVEKTPEQYIQQTEISKPPLP